MKLIVFMLAVGAVITISGCTYLQPIEDVTVAAARRAATNYCTLSVAERAVVRNRLNASFDGVGEVRFTCTGDTE